MHIYDCDNCALLIFARPPLYAALPPPHYFLTNASLFPIWYLGGTYSLAYPRHMRYL